MFRGMRKPWPSSRVQTKLIDHAGQRRAAGRALSGQWLCSEAYAPSSGKLAYHDALVYLCLKVRAGRLAATYKYGGRSLCFLHAHEQPLRQRWYDRTGTASVVCGQQVSPMQYAPS